VASATVPNTESFSFKARTPLEVTFAVWRALFLREALSRITATRSAVLWLFFEPVFHVSYMLVLYTVIRTRVIGGIDTVLWLLGGILIFLLFRRVSVQAGRAVSSNAALFTYRQVKPVDTVLIRSVVELMILILVAAILLFGAFLAGHDVFPADPLTVLLSIAGIWLLALGWGLIRSVFQELVPESANLFNMMMAPLYIMSGAILPLTKVPYPYLDWLMYNPIVHAIESVRLGFSTYYHAPAGVSLAYLFAFALIFVFAGLALHRHFALRLVSQ